jgi:hypothetical protein
MTSPSAVESDLPAWEDCTPADPGTPAVALRALRRRDGVSRASRPPFTKGKKPYANGQSVRLKSMTQDKLCPVKSKEALI